MLNELLRQEPWLAVCIWALLYVSDYALTLWGEALLQRGAGRHLVFEGSSELNPMFERDVAALQWMNPRVLLILVATTIGLLIWAPPVVENSPENFEFVMGLFILMECAIHVRHFRNIAFDRYAVSSSGIEGSLSMSRDVALRVSAVEMLGFAGIFAFAFLLTSSWWMAGGAAGCLYAAVANWWWLRRLRRTGTVGGAPSDASLT